MTPQSESASEGNSTPKTTVAKERPLGYINFDGLSGDNNEVEIRVPGDRLDLLRRGQYVLLETSASHGGTLYLARIIRGPFYVPDAVGRDSAFARASVLQADTVAFHPDYHGVCVAEILGRIADEQSLSLSGVSSRPLPQTAVKALTDQQIERLLGLSGDLFLGELSGYEGVRVRFRSDDKRVLPRNLGIFGTVGSGKTNTSQVIIEGAARSGWSVIVLDVEGEYVDMDQPSAEAKEKVAIRRTMERLGLISAGLDHLSVFHCRGTEPSRKDSKQFGLRFDRSDPWVLTEILSLTDAQSDRFMEVYYELTSSSQTRHAPKQGKGLAATLLDDDEETVAIGLTLNQVIQAVEQRVGDKQTQGKVSWQVLLRKLRKIQRLGLFDKGDDLGDYSELLVPGQVSVFDVSNAFNVWVNNLVISDILRGLFNVKKRDRENRTPRVMVVIEEAHTFVSRENINRMEATLDVLRDISRRGRKRWLSLCFISQQPSHLPPEIYELCNTKIVHQTTGGKNLDALKNSAGGVNPAIWGEIPILGQGRCLIISPQFRHPLLCDVRPCTSNRRYTE